MKIKEYLPTDPLRPYLKSYRLLQSHAEITNRVVPNTSFALAFRLKGKVSYIKEHNKMELPAITFSGLRQSVRLINYAPDTAVLVVLFRETAITQFFKQPLHTLFEQSIALDYFFPGSEIAELEERLAEVENILSKITVVEQFLLSKLLYRRPDPLVTAAIAKMYAVSGHMRIKEILNYFYISQDAFEKRFRKVTGATPKQFSNILRMNAAIRQKPPVCSFLDIALQNGYYDQAHFNKNFKIFTGQTPTEFYQATAYW